MKNIPRKFILNEKNQSRLIRYMVSEANNIPIVYVDGYCPPITQGKYHSFRWKGRWKTAPGSYQSSTREIIVGKNWYKKIKCPKGCRFFFDNYGFGVYRENDGMDYHPTKQEINSNNFVYSVRTGLAENFKRRLKTRKQEKENKRIEKIYNRQIESTYVNLYDSRRAGNCVEGTLQFAERKLNLTRQQILVCPWLLQVKANKLLRIARNDNRIHSAVRQAWLRETTVSI